MSNQILIIENNLDQSKKYRLLLQAKGYCVTEVDTIKSAKAILKSSQVAVIILAIDLPDGCGIEFIKEIKQQHIDTQIVLFTNNNSINNAVCSIRYGALEYIIKGEDFSELIVSIERAMKIVLEKFNDSLRFTEIGGLRNFHSIIGESQTIQKVKFLGEKVAITNATVLLLGETGVGKDILAEAIHSGSSRSKHAFVAINCSAIGQEMLECELFGYKAGAFTGALKDKKGLFEEADMGTIFLDEIGDMDLLLQSKILRVLENKSFIKMGDTKTAKTDCRIIAATHVDLLDAVKKGKFREDLYYRISSFIINIPPLRERLSDIPKLSVFFVRKIAQRLHMPIPIITDPFMNSLINHNWPGNIRELTNVLEKAMILSTGSLTLDLLDFNEKENISSSLQVMEHRFINNILIDCMGNKRKAARKLGISIATLYKKIG
ncbi:sigma-54-dependent transcriptional regulator [Pedobacter mendelii]|uniref:Sigma-54-dependent Fis family transcriptional regulator n=1 Tax=Pedobacter mendelii TaxID=1908240 RepID=A0ABQ2BPU2_9SPHI|nr:sigma-54 dependent transcriptional regulator [Pedobacter mendelii]GGI28637.1 sigma-54-dependent Fis family transcriptional regulator [Pedobacter mendelii]